MKFSTRFSGFQNGGFLPVPGRNDDPEMLYYNKYNTSLTSEEKIQYDQWLKQVSEEQKRDVSMDRGTYDLQGYWKNDRTTDADGHGSDKWKKPNHPKFSNESIYNGAEGFYGGRWEGNAFQPSKQTVDLYGEDSLNRYFSNEPNRPEFLDMSRFKTGINKPSPLVYKNGGKMKFSTRFSMANGGLVTKGDVTRFNADSFTNGIPEPYPYGASGIHIKKKNRGKFTASANRAGMGVQEFAGKVLANKENYSPTLVKRANFARNASKWKRPDGGTLQRSPQMQQLDLNARLFESPFGGQTNYGDFKSSVMGMPADQGELLDILRGSNLPLNYSGKTQYLNNIGDSILSGQMQSVNGTDMQTQFGGPYSGEGTELDIMDAIASRMAGGKLMRDKERGITIGGCGGKMRKKGCGGKTKYSM